MSALAHYLEEEGIAAVAISLIRPQSEKTRPPRALWVPFELGRPLGPPGDPTLQKRVLRAALGLLERGDGPVLIEDFASDDPRAVPDPAWQPPFRHTPPVGAAAIAAGLGAEIAELAPAHRAWIAQAGRTTVGLSGLPAAECGAYVGAWLRGEAAASPREGYSAPLLLRFAVDDLKAYFLEAAAAGAGRPSSRQLGDWLWHETAAGAAFQALRAAHMDSADARLKLIAGNFLVPAMRVRAA